MTLSGMLRRAAALGPRRALRAGLERLGRLAAGTVRSAADGRRSTRTRGGAPTTPLARLVAPLPREALAVHAESLALLAELHLAHRFDLLGSGWVAVRHGLRARGLEGHRYESGPRVEADREGRWLDARMRPGNREESRRLWRLVDAGYVPIDWHVDFKSGHRFDERTTSRFVRFGHLPGVDVKVPWELGRMQHLVTLACAHAAAREGLPGFREARVYAREVRNQALDFLASCPPRFGVQWICAMDVAIRAANLLLAFDLLRAHGHADAELERELADATREHLRHVRANLERSAELIANHYLADVAGILFASAYLPAGPESDEGLRFAGVEVVAEIERQFRPDGSNFEGSTAYHRLSAEIAVYAIGLLLRLGAAGERPAPAVPDRVLEKLGLMADATAVMTGPDGRIVQVGDNDSGRFVRLTPVGARATAREARARLRSLDGDAELGDEARVFVEDPLDHGHLCAAVGAVLGRSDLLAAHPATLEEPLLGALARGTRGTHTRAPGGPPRSRWPGGGLGAALDAARACAHVEVYTIPLAPPVALVPPVALDGAHALSGLRLAALPDFGLWVFRSGRLFLAVRAGSIGQDGRGGHDHNDQLGIDLRIDGIDWARDPGTYLYTPAPALRNAYRAASAHFVPQVAGREPARLDRDIFFLGGAVPGECLHFGADGFAGRHAGYGPWVYRVIELASDAVRITDASAGGALARKQALLGPGATGRLPCSPGYGLLER